jgi:hypothetical protein
VLFGPTGQHSTGCGMHEVTETKDARCAAAVCAADAVSAAPHRRVLLPGWGVAASSAPEQQHRERGVPSVATSGSYEWLRVWSVLFIWIQQDPELQYILTSRGFYYYYAVVFSYIKGKALGLWNSKSKTEVSGALWVIHLGLLTKCVGFPALPAPLHVAGSDHPAH